MRPSKEHKELFKAICQEHAMFVHWQSCDPRISEMEKYFDGAMKEIARRAGTRPKTWSRAAYRYLLKNKLIRAFRDGDDRRLKPTGHNCRFCCGLGYEVYADSWDRGNGNTCPHCLGWGRLFGRRQVSVKEFKPWA